ncbi:protein kinase [Streptomyces sp. NPDC090025]|uniref:serine/threonine-protein kinase n=1 Tax=Streptomyces sp. NPDC090025 TaxID=3365922 RepID=UPI003838E0E9
MSSGASGENERLAGRYRVVRQLGRGGMGIVWLAVDEVLGREVAVKELRTYNDASGPELADLRLRMQREARAAARVRHQGVVAVHDVTEHQGRPVIVMELVEGPSLDGVLTARGTLEPREAAAVGAAVLDALAAAHDAGVLHRDVKPGNVLLEGWTADGTPGRPGAIGRVVLTDFGIAAMDDPDDGAATHLTRSGQIVGSLDYLAPERAQGHEPGPASDVWALGATLYAAVEGGAPFRRTSTWSTLNAIVVEPFPEPRRAGPLVPVLQLLLAKDPARRPDARTAAELLRAVAEGRDEAAAPGQAGPGATAPPGAFGPPAVSGPAVSGPAVSGPSVSAPVPGGTVPPPVPEQLRTPTEPGLAAGAFGTYGPPPGTGPRQGYGPPAPGPAPVTQPAFGGGYGAPVPPGPAVTGPAGAPPRRRKRSGALAAAAVAAVVLAGAGVTYSLSGRDDGTGGDRRQVADGTTGATPGGDPGRALDPGESGTDSPGPSGSASPSAAASRDAGKGGEAPTGDPTAGAARPTGPAASRSPRPGATKGGNTGTGSGSSGGTRGATGSGGTGAGATTAPPKPAGPACTSRGGGAYDCQVWRTEKTYRHDGGEMGIVNAGTNYFYCQVDLGRRETYGRWTNIWWARTDDDSGNTNVYFSVVYIKGGENDKPVPGLPIC